MNLAVLGINFRTAPVGLRERVSFPNGRMPDILARMQQDLPQAELVLLSTCNRTELYAAGDADRTDRNELIRSLVNVSTLSDDDLQAHVYHKQRLDAVEHLMTVAASLDSMVVGETEILAQVKQAYGAAVEAGTAGSTIRPLFQRVFRVAKRIRSETDICRGRVSVGSLSVDLAEKIFSDLSSKTVMTVGAGEVAEQVLSNLVDRGVGEALVVNRSLDRGRALADRHQGTAIPFDRLGDYLPRADIVISSTGAPHCVIKAGAVRDAMGARHGRPMLLVDLAVPRDIETKVGDLENVYLYEIDDLERVAAENLARRQKAADHARNIIREEVAEASSMFKAHSRAEIMRQLDDLVRGIEESELERTFAKQSVAPFPEHCDKCREKVRDMLHRALSKMVAAPKKALNESLRDNTWDDTRDAVRLLFGLTEDDDDGNA